MDNIRLLRSTHPQIAAQMTNLETYNQVSNKSSISRDMSIVTGIHTDLRTDTTSFIVSGNITYTCEQGDMRTHAIVRNEVIPMAAIASFLIS